MSDSRQAACNQFGVSASVYAAFENRAMRLWNKGKRHYGAKAIIEVLRYETAISDDDKELKINNNATSKIVRLFQSLNPNQATMFKTRERA